MVPFCFGLMSNLQKNCKKLPSLFTCIYQLLAFSPHLLCHCLPPPISPEPPENKLQTW